MRSFIAFVLGIILGALIMLVVPNYRRDELAAQLQTQVTNLQDQIQKLGEQIKTVHIEISPTPTGTVTPTPTPGG